MTATVVIGLILIAATWAYLLSGPVANLFLQLIDVTGLLFASYYILTALATIVFYRRRVASNPWDALMAGLLPFCAAGFLGWIVLKSVQAAPASQRWSLAGIAGAGVLLMLAARVMLKSPFFGIPRESAGQ